MKLFAPDPHLNPQGQVGNAISALAVKVSGFHTSSVRVGGGTPADPLKENLPLQDIPTRLSLGRNIRRWPE